MKAKQRGITKRHVTRPGLLLWLLPLLVQFFAATSHDPDDCLAHQADEIAHHHQHEHQAHEHQDHHHDDAAHDAETEETVFGAASHHHGAQVSDLVRGADEDACVSCLWLSCVSFDHAMQLSQTVLTRTPAPRFPVQSSFLSSFQSSQRNRGPPAF